MQIVGVKAVPVKGGLGITGEVYYSTIDYGPLSGHLHVTAHRSNGRPAIEVDTRWEALSPKGVGYAHFGALIRTADYHEITGIKVEYRRPR
ncbi:hypothetical protein ABC974_11815 [Sphingomonas oligophenolica]|uniref:Uncharacterized protein n=1 Tax=Sphingomonas oligophenolica TaxID=301154 RepID=A0ABU9Y3F6_9SPHN